MRMYTYILIFYGKKLSMYVTAQNIYDKLLEAGIHQQTGEAKVEFMGVNVRMLDRSAIGNLLQEWLGNWLSEQQISFRVKANTQEFPDFLLDEKHNNIGLLEIKTFDWERSANFDVANFDAYRRSLLTTAYRLDADYLILAYQLDSEGYISIPRMWLRKIWQITGASERYPLKCQVKQNVIYNIRPVTWYSNRSIYSPFENRAEFVSALHQTIRMYTSIAEADDWLQTVKSKYVEQVGNPL